MRHFVIHYRFQSCTSDAYVTMSVVLNWHFCFEMEDQPQGNDEEKAVGRSILVEVLEALRIAAVMLSPVTPTLSEAIYLQLGYSADQYRGLKLEDSKWGGKPPACTLILTLQSI